MSGPIVDCPICKRKTEFSPSNRWRPFCSERCKMIDMGAWASGSYAIEGNPDELQSDAEDDGSASGARGRYV